jgi:hypothetical protein
MSQLTAKWKLPQIGPLQIGIILLVLITAFMHLYLGIRMGAMMSGPRPSGPPLGGPPPGGGSSIMAMLPLPLPILFDLNFVGYMVLVIALYLPALQRFQHITRWLLIAYTAVTIILWYLISASHADMEDYTNKAVEIVLIALLLIEEWQGRLRARLD